MVWRQKLASSNFQAQAKQGLFSMYKTVLVCSCGVSVCSLAFAAWRGHQQLSRKASLPYALLRPPAGSWGACPADHELQVSWTCFLPDTPSSLFVAAVKRMQQS